MKFSTVSQLLLSGALGVSAVALPHELDDRAGQTVPFITKFETLSLAEAKVKGPNDTDIVRTNDVKPLAVGCTNPAVRVEWRNMTPANKLSFVNAIQCLWNRPTTGLTPAARNRYEELVWVHQQMAPTVHGAGIFLPWHRYYVHTWMKLLREECGYTAPLPWWDEVRDAGNFAGSGLFTSEYFGSLPPVTSSGQGTCINDGKFGGRTLHIGPGYNNVDRCLSRGENKAATANVNQAFFDTCVAKTNFADMRDCIERGPHAHGHNGIGPVMSDPVSSPADPIFFLHHTFVDRMWKKWQNKEEWRWTTISGCAAPGNPCPAMTLDTVLTSRGIRPDTRVRDFMDTENSYLCYKYDY